jgi:hypothetical protein
MQQDKKRKRKRSMLILFGKVEVARVEKGVC